MILSRNTFGLLLLTTAVLVLRAHGACPSGTTQDGCLQKSEFAKLSTGDPSYYCETGAQLAAQAQNCLKACGFSEQNPYLVDQKQKINSFCKSQDPLCPNVTDTFVAQTRCYELYGGLDKIFDDIVTNFTIRKQINCQPLHWGRYCQTTQSCSYNQNLDIKLLQDNEKIILGLSICGSEKIKDLLQYLEVSEGCSDDKTAAIASKCNISCAVTDADNQETVCSLLQSQASCLEENTLDCTRAQRQYVLPRLNTYAAANKYLQCNIKFFGIPVQSCSMQNYEYSPLINKCLLIATRENTLTFDSLQPLLNRDTLVVDFCRTLSADNGQQKIEQKMTDCRNSFLAVQTPQAVRLTRAQDIYLDKNMNFVPDIGTFPLDSFGMGYLINWLTEDCSNSLQWSDRICLPAAERLATTSRNTPPPKTTSARPGPEITRKQNNVGEDFVYNSSGALVPAALLTIASLIRALIFY